METEGDNELTGGEPRPESGPGTAGRKNNQRAEVESAEQISRLNDLAGNTQGVAVVNPFDELGHSHVGQLVKNTVLVELLPCLCKVIND